MITVVIAILAAAAIIAGCAYFGQGGSAEGSGYRG
jgi:hypothetical protein